MTYYQQIALVLFSSAGYIVWILFSIFLSFKIEEKYGLDSIVSGLLISVVIPCLVIGLLLLII